MFAKEFHKITRLSALALLGMMLITMPTLAASPTAGDGGIVFSLHAPDAQAVFIAGAFNGWNASDLALTKGADGIWLVTVALDAGSYEYKFVVDDEWLQDPDNTETKSDPFGGANSLVTVRADGTVSVAAAAVVAAPAAKTPAASASDISVGAPRAVDGGIEFTYQASGAGSVTLAGTFNGWNADDFPLTADGQGNWVIVKELGPGMHEYKFVVDGNWLADPENPDTQSDPYGGVNSVVTVDDNGQLIATESGAEPAESGTGTSSSALNAKVTLDGRYMTRFQYAKNVPVDVNDETIVDPRYRLQRPTQSVDLNFTTEVSDVATTYMRLRLDSDQNIIQNNVAAFMDEAYLKITPENFTLTAYWNQEVFTGEDILKLGGDVDLPGTILHDHLDYGKGTAGALLVADPWGVRTHLFFANVHNSDYYNNPELYDNLGEDRFSLRFSKQFGKFELGTPLYVERALVWLDFGAGADIPALIEHQEETLDSSPWYEVDNYLFNAGLDLSFHANESWTFGTEILYREATQRFVTGNESGQNNTHGALDLPFLNRDEILYVGQVDFRPGENSTMRLQHQTARMNGGNIDERLLTYTFKPQDAANKNIFYSVGESPAVADLDSTEFNWNWQTESHGASLWLRRANRKFDFGNVREITAADSTITEEIWYLAGSVNTGQPSDKLGHFELEAGYNLADRGTAGLKDNQLEMIFRYDRDLSRNVGLIADLRFIRYHMQGDAEETTDTDYFNPFVGFRYTPIRKLELVLAYGVDPIDYSIDYSGRQTGRWMRRQNYLFDHPLATNLDAENHLKNAQVVTFRAQLLF